MPTVLENIDSSGKKYFVEINTGEATNGLPIGGATGEVLAKASNSDYDTEWVTPSGGDVDSVNGMTGVVVLDTDDIGEGTTNKYLSSTQKTDLTDGGATTLHKHSYNILDDKPTIPTSHTQLTDIGTNTHAQIDTKLASLLNEREITKESTGFTNNENITVTYNEITRKVTLTGTFVAYYKGEVVSILTNGWESPAHADVAGTYFLYYCDGGLLFDTNPWTYDCLQIAFIQYNGTKLAIRETHGFMQWQSHKEFHETIGTYKTGGGTFSDYTLNSTTATNRRPDISNVTVRDEDLTSTILALTTKQYTNRYLTGAAVRTFSVLQPEIIPVNGNIPYYNQFNGTNWVQTPMTNNTYGAIFVVGVPTTDDAISQRYRFMFVQPQTVGALVDIQALTPNDLTHGDSSLLVSEFVFFAKIIIQVSGNNWSITSIEDITGTRLNQTSSPSGTYLSIVAHDTTLTGDGTSINPLAVANPCTGTNTGDQDLSSYLQSVSIGTTLTGNGTSIDPLDVDTTVIETVENTINRGMSFIATGSSTNEFTLAYPYTEDKLLINQTMIIYFEGNVLLDIEEEALVKLNSTTSIPIVDFSGNPLFVKDVLATAKNYIYAENVFYQIPIYSPNSLTSIIVVSNEAELTQALELNIPYKEIFIEVTTIDITSDKSWEVIGINNVRNDLNITGEHKITFTGTGTINLYGKLYTEATEISTSGLLYINYLQCSIYTFFIGTGTRKYQYSDDLENHEGISQQDWFSGVNLKTINGTSLKGSGNIVVSALDKATGTEINTGSDDAKYVTAKAISDSDIAFIGDIPSKDGWNLQSGTFTFGSADSPTFIMNTPDLQNVVGKGDKIKLTQSQALSGYWSFDTNSSADVGTFTMANIGTPTYTAGKFGNALTLNGSNQALSITDTALLKPTGTFTIGAWIKTSNTGALKMIYQSLSINTNNAGTYLLINTSNNLVFHTGKNTGTTLGVDLTQIIGTTNVCDGNYHYVVATYNNNYGQIYIDGNLEVSGYMLAPAYAATNYVRIGCYNPNGSNSSWFNGQIDDLFLINGYALDEKTIRDKYTANTAQGTSAFDVDKIFLVHVNPTSSTLTLYGGTDFQLSNSAISNVYYSKVKNPQGYNSKNEKWSIMFKAGYDVTIATPAQNTWYNLYSMSIHLGDWITCYSGTIVLGSTASQIGVRISSTLSKTNNSETDTAFSYYSGFSGASGTLATFVNPYICQPLSLSAKTTMYVNARTTLTNGANILTSYANQPVIIKAISIYC